MAKTQPDQSKIIHNGNARFGVYVTAAVIVAAVIVGTLQTTGILSGEQVENWTETVVSLTGQFTALIGLVLAAANRSTDKPVKPVDAAGEQPGL